MYQQLIERSPDLKRIRDEGFEIEVSGGYLIIHQIPYVNHLKEVKHGILVSSLDLSSNTSTTRPRSHVVLFKGDYPCNKDGTPIAGIKHSSQEKKIFDSLTVNHSFSNKPQGGYGDYYQKMTRYIEIISAPAKSIDPKVTEKTFKVIKDNKPNAVFNYIDTNSSRANINMINSKLEGHKVAIVGVGGTGAYILDLIAKTPVQEIHIFDGKELLLHNAFRSPGAASIEVLKEKMNKALYYHHIYSNMHKHIIPHPENIDILNIELLINMSFVFLCIDNDKVKKDIINYLLKNGIDFIDVGLGVNIIDDSLISTIRTTVGTTKKNDHIPYRISFGDDQNNEYSSNIQIAELNSLNAAYAVIEWKKLLGFYQDLKHAHNITYNSNVSQLLSDDY